MNLKDIQELVLKRESLTIEFKKSTAQLRGAFETICAFLNQQGGIVLIGVTDKGAIIGQEVADHTKQIIAVEKSKLEPPAQVTIEYIDVVENKQIIALIVEQGMHTPYIYNGCAFQRLESTTSIMPQIRYEQLLIERRQLNHVWESYPATYNFAYLDQEQIIRVVRLAVEQKRLSEFALRADPHEALQRFNLINDKGQLLNAAVVLFGTRKTETYPQCELRLGCFKGIDKSEFLDNQIIHNHAFALFEIAMEFIARHLPIRSYFERGNPQRIDTPLIPYAAIREALVNAFCHRDYSVRGGAVSIGIYTNRLEIASEGRLLPNVTLESLKQAHGSSPRNPLIAHVFHACNLIEKWGSGVQKMMVECQKAGIPEPEFLETDNTFTVKFYFAQSSLDYTNLQSFEDKEKLIKSLSPRQLAILALLQQAEALSISKITQLLPNPPARRTLKDDLGNLKSHNLIDTIGKGKNTVWSIIKK